jgi:hypothetical protein
MQAKLTTLNICKYNFITLCVIIFTLHLSLYYCNNLVWKQTDHALYCFPEKWPDNLMIWCVRTYLHISYYQMEPQFAWNNSYSERGLLVWSVAGQRLEWTKVTIGCKYAGFVHWTMCLIPLSWTLKRMLSFICVVLQIIPPCEFWFGSNLSPF